jgi:hypothetical protein
MHRSLQAARKPLSFEFSLYLSRACLGKMSVFIHNWLKKTVFSYLLNRHWVGVGQPEVREDISVTALCKCATNEPTNQTGPPLSTCSVTMARNVPISG